VKRVAVEASNSSNSYNTSRISVLSEYRLGPEHLQTCQQVKNPDFFGDFTHCFDTAFLGQDAVLWMEIFSGIKIGKEHDEGMKFLANHCQL
jgi:hypothetical protein